MNKYKEDIIFDHLNLSHFGQVEEQGLFFDSMLKGYEDRDFQKYLSMKEDNVPIYACLKRSKSSDNLFFGGKTNLEKKYCDLPLPYTKFHIKREIKRFHKMLLRKCESFRNIIKKKKVLQKQQTQLQKDEVVKKSFKSMSKLKVNSNEIHLSLLNYEELESNFNMGNTAIIAFQMSKMQ